MLLKVFRSLISKRIFPCMKTALIKHWIANIASSPEDSDYSDDEEDSNPDHETMHTTFNLIAHGESIPTPIFTRALLQRIASEVTLITWEQTTLCAEGTIKSLSWKRPDGQIITTWKPVANANSVTVNYFTRVEMVPAYQSRFSSTWKRSTSLRALNPTAPTSELTAPYHIISYRRVFDTSPVDLRLIKRLQRTQHLWKTICPSYRQLTLITNIALSRLSTPMTPMVGIGLGKVGEGKWYANSALQHITVFGLAETIDTYNAVYYPGSEEVKVVLSNPCYEACNREVLQKISTRKLEFGWSDPEVLLSITSITFLVTVYLPISVPLMQILVDLFITSPSSALGILLCDQMPDERESKRWYCMRNRDAPHVARWLKWYDKWTKGFVGLREEVSLDVWGRDRGRYWVCDMGFWVRRDGK
jgi:hypothetical protein